MSQKRQKEFSRVLMTSIRVIIASSLAATVVISLLLPPVLDLAFDFPETSSNLLIWTTRAFTVGLVAHTLLEVIVRAFYARQEAKIPLVATFIRTVAFVILIIAFYKMGGAVGIALADSIAVAVETVILFVLFRKFINKWKGLAKTVTRSVVACIVAMALILVTFQAPIPPLAQIMLAILSSSAVFLVFMTKEIKLLLKL